MSDVTRLPGVTRLYGRYLTRRAVLGGIAGAGVASFLGARSARASGGARSSITPQVRHALIEARGQVWARYGTDPNVTGCGIGYRRRGGVVTSEAVVIAMVVDKLPAGALSARRLLPASVRVNGTDYGVDVVEVGLVYASGGRGSAAPRSLTTSGPVTGPYRPLVQGCSISNAVNTTTSGPPASPMPVGTLGCFVYDDSNENGIGDVYLLAAGHVLAGGINSLWSPGSTSDPGDILQPGLADQQSTGSTYSTPVATTTYVSPLDTTPGSLANTADCGVARLTQQDGWEPSFANDLMPPISDTHPAVGMCIASGNDGNGNSFLANMQVTLSQAGMPLMGTTSTIDWTADPQVGMNIEKVGRSSGYTSSTVDATDVIVTVRYVDTMNNVAYPVTMSGMIWSQFFSMDGDSGAVACQGGDGHTYVPPFRAPCALLSNVQSYYALPSVLSDNTLTNNLQAKVLTQTLCGNLLTGLVYLNQQTAIDRLAGSTGPAYNQATAQAYFQQLYATYRPVIAGMVTNPSGFTLTPAMAADWAHAWQMLYEPPASGGQGILTPQEAGLAFWAFAEAFGTVPQGGYSYQQMQAKLDDPATYDFIHQLMCRVPTIVMP